MVTRPLARGEVAMVTLGMTMEPATDWATPATVVGVPGKVVGLPEAPGTYRPYPAGTPLQTTMYSTACCGPGAGAGRRAALGGGLRVADLVRDRTGGLVSVGRDAEGAIRTGRRR